MNLVPSDVGQSYFKAFVKTMRREWFGIDRHRLDKFMMLIRKFYAQHLRFLQDQTWCVPAATAPCILRLRHAFLFTQANISQCEMQGCCFGQRVRFILER